MFVLKKWMIYVILLVIMILTTPDRDAHERKIQEIFSASGTNPDIVHVSLEHSSLTYHNIYIFTYTKQNRRVLTFGGLGMVFNVGN